MIRKEKLYWMTVIELLVTLSLLTILALIAFVSFIWHSIDARDTTRISNLDLIYNSFKTVKITTWKYPIPDKAVEITYLWQVLWNHWIIWWNVTDYINSIPFIDPKYKKKNKELYFSYWVLADNSKFQVWTILENKDREILWFIDNTYANNEKAYVIWDYNWYYLNSFVLWETHILSLPGLVLTDTRSHSIIIDSKSYFFSVNETSSLPWRYFNKSDTSEEVEFIPKILYKWKNCWVQTDKDIVDFITNLKDSYDREPFISMDSYNDIFDDYDYLVNNFSDFSELKTLWIGINKSLECDLNSFKTSNLFPVTCPDNDWTFELVADWTSIKDTCNYDYEWDWDWIIQTWFWVWGSKWIHISWLSVNKSASIIYKTFSYNIIKVKFDFRALLWDIDTTFKLYLDWNEVFSFDGTSPWIEIYDYYQSPAIQRWLHEFRWELTKSGTGTSDAELFLDNISVYCTWLGLWC